MNKLTDDLNLAWDEDGFLGLLRDSSFNHEKGLNLLQILQGISFDDVECIPKDLVSLLWYIPIFMEWQSQRLNLAVNENYITLEAEIHNEIERILGTP